MNEKLNIQDLIDTLAERHGMSKKNADSFVKEFFQLIEESLEKDKYVKIRGLGTFKLIDVGSRESVNVNTGERFEIQGHTKVSFTPEPALKDIINRPFSHFETVVLNDATVLEDTLQENDSEDDEDTEIKTPEQEVEEKVALVEEATIEEPLVETVVEEPLVEPEPEVEEEKPEKTEPEAMPENIVAVEPEPSEPVIKDTADSSTMKYFIGIVVFVVLLCGGAVAFAKGFARSLGIPMIDVNHLTGHVLAHFIKAEGEDNVQPEFPFLCLLVSGGNSQIILVKAYNDMEILGQTIDDAAGEAIDKCSKVMGLGYPGGPIIDKLARQGNPKAFSFSKPHIPGLDYSFSGLKTSFLYSLRDWMKDDPDFIEHHKMDLAASLEATVVDILMDKLRKAAKQYKIKEVAVAGGVSANNGLRNAFREHAGKYGWKIFIPKFSYTTDNAAMIAITGYFKYMDKDFCPMEAPAYSRVTLG